MSVRAANEGRAKPNTWITVIVELTNQGADLTGELIVKPTQPKEAGGGWDRFPEYVVPVTLPAGGKKKVPVEVPLQQWNKVLVTLRAAGAEVAAETVTLTMLPGDASLIGVLSAGELGIPALNRSGQPANSHVVRLDADTLPVRAALLEHYDVIALSRFDTATLSKEQLQALEAWVGKGGTLLLAGGPEWRRTFAGLPPALVPVAVTGAGDTDLAPLGALVDKPLKGTGPVSQGRLLRGQALAKSGDTVLLAQEKVGAGKVVYLAADPDLEPLAAWPGQGDLYARFAGSSRAARFDWGGDMDGMMAGALQRIPGLGLPAVSTVALLLVGYLLLVGPVNYIVLKRMDRREWAWLSVPLISVLFVGAVYGLSVGRRTPLLSHIITVTELAPGTGTGAMKTYVGLYAPSQNSLSVPVENARLVKPLFYGGGPESGPTGRVRSGDRTTVELLGFNNYTMKGFTMEHDVTVGGLELTDVSYDGIKVTGRLLNRLNQPVRDIRLFTQMNSVEIGSLEAGARSEPFELAFSGGILNPKMAMRGGMPPGVFVASGGPQDETVYRREQIWNATLGYGNRQSMPGTITVGGWTDSPLGEVKLPDLGRVHQGGNLVWAALPIPLDPERGDIPPGVILGVPSGGSFGRSPAGYHLQPGSSTFVFQVPPLNPARVAEVNLLVGIFGDIGQVATLSAKDRTSGAWVELKPDPQQVLADWQRFIGPEGVLEVRLESRAHFEMAAPTISVKGVAR